MNWLCPLTFWPDDCLSHGLLFWFSTIMILLTVFIIFYNKIQKMYHEEMFEEFNRRFKNETINIKEEQRIKEEIS